MEVTLSGKTSRNWLKHLRWGAIAALLLVMGLGQAHLAKADSPEEDLAKINANIQKALTAAQAGDLTTAKAAFKSYDDAWFDVEDGVKAKSKTAYRNIEQKMADVNEAFAKVPADNKAVATALSALDAEHQTFIKASAVPAPVVTAVVPVPASNLAPAQPQAKATGPVTIGVVLEQLNSARIAQAKGDSAAAAIMVKQFQDSWLEVEGEVKTRSAEDYRQTENDMALAYNLLTKNSPEAKAVLDRMYSRLEPYKEASRYGIFDATIILLREGLEALLVVVALLTFLRKSGNGDKQPWIWSGVGVGLAVSIALGIIIQLLFSSAINPSNREIVEGTTGLVASVMLIYISYWMHSKSSAVAWNRYIKQKSTAALAKGSLIGLAVLSFLAIFREGAETVLFFLGMGSGISLSDLVIGLAIGTVALVVIGFLLVVAGLKIPMGPFFLTASILVFYLCFKFVGMGIHALQVGKVISATPASYLPESGFFGLFPTWETTIPQLLLLAVGVGVVVYERLKNKNETKQPQATSNTAPAVK